MRVTFNHIIKTQQSISPDPIFQSSESQVLNTNLRTESYSPDPAHSVLSARTKAFSPLQLHRTLNDSAKDKESPKFSDMVESLKKQNKLRAPKQDVHSPKATKVKDGYGVIESKLID